MKILINRWAFKDTYTIGKLYVDNKYICDTLEDKVRPDGIKIAGDTAIPAGKYLSGLTFSMRFQKYLPEIFDVPKFAGIRIHSGNTAADTDGCILVGKNKEAGKVLESQETMKIIMTLYKEAVEKNEPIIIEIICL
ncbi:MAG: DUF5675 family protein [Endomicrobium sp.]|jgi:hypothetical protein|nr:DUF5675 family protein [Endomicrobium sp.]